MAQTERDARPAHSTPRARRSRGVYRRPTCHREPRRRRKRNARPNLSSRFEAHGLSLLVLPARHAQVRDGSRGADAGERGDGRPGVFERRGRPGDRDDERTNGRIRPRRSPPRMCFAICLFSNDILRRRRTVHAPIVARSELPPRRSFELRPDASEYPFLLLLPRARHVSARAGPGGARRRGAIFGGDPRRPRVPQRRRRRFGAAALRSAAASSRASSSARSSALSCSHSFSGIHSSSSSRTSSAGIRADVSRERSMSPASSSVSTYPGLARDAKPPLASSSSPMVCTRVPASYAGTAASSSGASQASPASSRSGISASSPTSRSISSWRFRGTARSPSGGGTSRGRPRGAELRSRGAEGATGTTAGASSADHPPGVSRRDATARLGGERGVVVVEISRDAARALAVRAAARGRGCGPAAAGRRCGRGDGRGGRPMTIRPAPSRRSSRTRRIEEPEARRRTSRRSRPRWTRGRRVRTAAAAATHRRGAAARGSRAEQIVVHRAGPGARAPARRSASPALSSTLLNVRIFHEMVDSHTDVDDRARRPRG